MSLRVILDFSERDLKHFRKLAQQARSAAKDLPPEKIVKMAKRLLADVDGRTGADFISERIAKLQVMIDMIEDKDWALPDVERKRVQAALAYFADPADLIPDHVPGVGFLDDAIMVELTVRELRHEIEAYHDFCNYRDAELSRRGKGASGLDRASYLQARRKQLISRMRRRRRRDFGGSGRARSPVSLF